MTIHVYWWILTSTSSEDPIRQCQSNRGHAEPVQVQSDRVVGACHPNLVLKKLYH